MFDDEYIDELESNGHSIFGGSKSHRFLRCYGSILAEIGQPDTAGIEAAEGTVAHEIAAFWLEWGRERHDFNDQVGRVKRKSLPSGEYDITVTAAMLNYIGRYIDWCREVPGEHYTEARVDYSCLTPIPKQGGFVDHFACSFRALVVTDLKYGTGVQVFAKRNSQIMLYALGVIYEWDWLYDFDRVTLRICQPRLDHFDVWETTKTDLLEWAETAKADMARCWRPDAPRTPGEVQCKFCKARATCGAFVALREKLADDTFEDATVTTAEIASAVERIDVPLPMPEVTSLTTTQLARVLRYRKAMEGFFDDAYAELSRRVVAGNEDMPPGWMLSQGKSARVVVSEPAAIARMKRLGYTPDKLQVVSFKSPAQLEALLVEDGFSKARATAYLKPVIRTLPGRPTLSLEAPGKTPALSLADDTFEDESL